MFKIKTTIFLFTLLLLQTACSNQDLQTQEGSISKENLIIRTRSETSSETIPLPIQLYVFNEKEECVQTETIETASEPYSYSFPSGTYEIIALAGATKEKYTLPEKETASKTSLITLKDSLDQLSDLAYGKIFVTLGLEEMVSKDINVKHILTKAAITVNDLPSRIIAASVTIKPLYSQFNLAGELKDPEEGVTTIDLIQQKDSSTWTTEEAYIYPSKAEKITILISLTQNVPQEDNSTQTKIIKYEYETEKIPESNKPFVINAFYQDINKVDGNINCEDWGEPINVSFDFGPNSTTQESTNPTEEPTETEDNNNELDLSAIPVEGQLWNDFLVLNIKDEANYKELYLLSTKEWDNVTPKEEDIQKCLDNYNETSGLTGWKMASCKDVASEDGYIFKKTTGLLENYNSVLEAAGKTPIQEDENYLCIKEKTNQLVTWRIGFTRESGLETNTNLRYKLRLINNYRLPAQ